MSTITTTSRVQEEEEVARETIRRPKRRRLLIAGIVLVPVLAFASVYQLFFTPDSPPPLTLRAQATGPQAPVAPGSWTIAPGSVAGYRVREKLLRLPASNDAVGRTEAITGGLNLALGQAGSIVIDRGLRVDVDVATLKSDAERRDDHMRTMAIETDLYPTATFVTTSDIVVPSDLVNGGRARLVARGDLTLHGVTRSVEIPFDTQVAGGLIEVVGSYSFGWDLFQMEQPNLNYVTVESDPTLEFHLLFQHG